MQRFVAVVAALFGVVTVFVGGRVLAGLDPGFEVFRPLVIFNTIMGVVYVMSGLRAWRDPRRGRTWAAVIALLNLIVLLSIGIAYAAGAGVAAQSLAAMSFRTLVWGGIFLVLARTVRQVAAAEASAQADEAYAGWVIRPVEDAPVTLASFYAVDHDDIDRLLDEFRASKTGDRQAAVALYREFKGRLERHIGWEEDILFPLFERLTGLVDNGPTVVMRAEHRRINELLEAIDATLAAGAMAIDADEAALLEALAAHNLKEENILYPMIDRQASAADREAVFARMRVELARPVPGTPGGARV